MVSRTSDCARSPTYPRRFKYSSRLGVPSLCGQQRLETRTPSVRQSKSGLGPPRGRSICHSSVKTAPPLRQLETGSRGRVGQCVGSRLEQFSRLRISLVGRWLKQVLTQNVQNTSANSPCVENTALVPSPFRTEHSTTPTATSYPRDINKDTGGSPTDESPTSRVTSIRPSYTATGISKSAQNLLLAAWRKGTSDSYSSAWRKWASWCCKKN